MHILAGINEDCLSASKSKSLEPFLRYGQKDIKCTKNGFFLRLWPPKIFLKKIFQHQLTIPSAHPVQISSCSDYCITLSKCGITQKSQKGLSLKKRGLASSVQPEPDFSRTYGFRNVLGINADCLNKKFHQDRYSRFLDLDKKHQKWSENGGFPHDFSGSVSFVPLWCPNFMQKIRKIL